MIRRKLYVLGVICAVLSLTLAACGGGEEAAAPQATSLAPTQAPTAAATQAARTTAAPTTAPTATAAPTPTPTPVPVPTGELRISMETLLSQRMHPDLTTGKFYTEPMYDWMIASDNAGKLDTKRSFVTSWETNADSTVWTFKVRDNLVFHNGDKATSADIQGSMEYTIRDGTRNNNGPRLKAGLDSFLVPDASTITVKYKTPKLFATVEFSPLDTTTVGFLMPTAYLKKVGEEGFEKAPVGSGPYKFKENRISDKVVYEATPRHWYYGVPKFATLSISVIPDANTRLAVLKTGAADLGGIAASQVNNAKSSGLNIYTKVGDTIGNIWLHKQWVPGNPLGNLKVRQALSLAIDRQGIVDQFLAGQGVPTLNYPVNSIDQAYQGERIPVPKQDLVKAKQLLAESGVGQVSLDMLIFTNGPPEATEIMEAVAVWWEQIGVKVKRLPTQYATFLQQWREQSFTNPTAAGVHAVATRPIAYATIPSYASADPAIRIPTHNNEDPENVPPAKAALNATNVADYVKNMRALQDLVVAKVNDLPLAELGASFAARPQVVSGFNPGKGNYVYNFLDVMDPNSKH